MCLFKVEQTKEGIQEAQFADELNWKEKGGNIKWYRQGFVH